MTARELASAVLNVAKNHKTLYILGCFGAPMNAKNKARYTKNQEFNKAPDRAAKINAASADTFGFDCVCLIKGILWGWNGDTAKVYGGAGYGINGVPDIGANSMINKCSEVSDDFSKIQVGEVVWMPGHIGVYVGDGLAVECTPIWKDGVQVTAVGNIGRKKGYNTRTWVKHGKLPYVTYEPEKETLYRVTIEGLPKTYADNLAETYENIQVRVIVEALPEEPEEWVPREGDKVYFRGNTQYSSSSAAVGGPASQGEAIITHVYKPGKSKHPYHLKRTGRTGPYGWVDAGTFEKI